MKFLRTVTFEWNGKTKNINYIAVSIKGSKKTRYRLTEPNHRIGKTFLFHFLRIVHFLEGVSVSEISTMVGVLIVSPSNHRIIES